MVLLTITQAAKDAIITHRRLSQQAPAPQDGEPDLRDPIVGGPVAHGQLIDITNALKKYSADEASVDCASDLETILRGSKIYTPPPKPKPEKSPEYVALMARLREDEERRAYERMINPLPPQETFAQRYPGSKAFGADVIKSQIADEVDEMTYADINRQMTLIINVLITIITCSVGIWITAWHWPTPARLGLSLGGSSVVAIAEVAIYFGYIKRMSDAKDKEVRKFESKEVVETWVIDGSTGQKTLSHGRDESLRQRKGKHR
ncbi:putative vacuolar proton-transporting V-type ATPase complex assembly protein [Elsinoe australis]|uniref:Putative vacuolar proton-transporting V-type ATPase complex assembly protein n=1 Tax=Elsinoe australis TaxID=40998 RepID=A0A4U7B0X6_9PEZI|nr:putative vacuolar proton-transporting V-type ATPase complex assembly protein [Elsinoe australis]